MMQAGNLSPAARAFHRLRERYDDDEKRRIDRAMAILGLTPEDKIWLAVVVAVDLIGALSREGDGVRAMVQAAIAQSKAEVDQAKTALATERTRVETAVQSATLAAHRAKTAAEQVVVAAESAGASVAESIGAKIYDRYGAVLADVTAERNDLATDNATLSLKLRLAYVAGTLAVGMALGWLLHGNAIGQIVKACHGHG